jgi:hypothetical protein
MSRVAVAKPTLSVQAAAASDTTRSAFRHRRRIRGSGIASWPLVTYCRGGGHVVADPQPEPVPVGDNSQTGRYADVFAVEQVREVVAAESTAGQNHDRQSCDSTAASR